MYSTLLRRNTCHQRLYFISFQNNLADEIVHGQVVKEIILQGNDRLPVSL